MRTHYENLKVVRDAPQEVIRAAYRALAQRHHPDRNPTSVEESARIMRIINAAYEVLSDPIRRREYDELLSRQEAKTMGIDIPPEIRAEPRQSAPRNEKLNDYLTLAGGKIISWLWGGLKPLLVVALVGALIKLPMMVSHVSEANRNSEMAERQNASITAADEAGYSAAADTLDRVMSQKQSGVSTILYDKKYQDADSHELLVAQYVELVEKKVIRNWDKPPSARSDVECDVAITQAAGGTVLAVSVDGCNVDDVDESVRTSIEAAVNAASPLPMPADPRLFQRSLSFVFKAQ